MGSDRRFVLARNRQFYGIRGERGEEAESDPKRDGIDEEREWTAPFYFAQFADTQFGMMGMMGMMGLEKSGRPDMTEEIARVRAAVRAVNALRPRPKFVIICGDLINAHPQMHPDLDPEVEAEQVRIFKDVLGDVDPEIPLVCVCGNHDVGNAPTTAYIERYRQRFGDDYFAFWCSGIRCIILNMQLFSDPSQAPDEYVRQQKWFDDELCEARAAHAKHILVFGHIPWFLETPDEPDTLDTKTVWDGGEMANGYFHIRQERRMPELTRMKKYGVRACFAGHWHQNGGGMDGAMEMIITCAVGMPLRGEPPGFRLVKVFEDDIKHRYFASTQVPVDVPLGDAERNEW